MTTPLPTGRVVDRDGHRTLVLTREFRAPMEDVWASVTEPDRLARWIGTWTGDPASGSVTFVMTAEQGAEPETMEIRECSPPRALHVTSRQGEGVWHLDLDLTHADGVTTLTLAQLDVKAEEAESVGPGWEYYLDRLVAVESGGDVGAIDFERDYYPAMLDHYRAQLG